MKTKKLSEVIEILSKGEAKPAEIMHYGGMAYLRFSPMSISQIQLFHDNWDGRNKTYDEYLPAVAKVNAECIKMELSDIGTHARKAIGLPELSPDDEVPAFGEAIGEESCLECGGTTYWDGESTEVKCLDCGKVVASPLMQCPTCMKLVVCEKTHNGVGETWHMVHCGYGHDQGVVNR